MKTFQVLRKRCSECLFSKGRIVSVERMAEVLADCAQQADEKFFVCHKSSMNGGNVCCRGFYDSPLANVVAIVQIARRLELVEFVDEKDLKGEQQ